MRAVADWFLSLLVTAAFAVALLGVAETLEARAQAAETAAQQTTVVVDAGHGGFDGGAVGTLTGVQEAGLNLTVAKLVQQELAARGLRVLMTREGGAALGADKERDMQKRRAHISDPEADLVVSIHMNKFSDRTIAGARTFYEQGSAEGQKLAQAVVDSLTDAFGLPRRLANPGDYFILRECACPAVLVECGFLSNPVDEQLLQDPAHQAALAAAVAEGIVAYLKAADA